MNRSMIDNNLNLSQDAGSAAVVMAGIAVNAVRRGHLANAIVQMGWTAEFGIVIQTRDNGQAVHLANALGLPSGSGQAAFLLPRFGEVNGFKVVVDVRQDAQPR